MSRIFEIIQEWFSAFVENLSWKKVLKFIFLILFILALLAIIILVFAGLITFIANNYQLLILALAIIAGAVYYVRYLQEQKETKRRLEEARISQQKTDEQRVRMEECYNLLRNCLYRVNNDLSSTTKLKRITNISQLDLGDHYIQHNNYVLFQYCIVKEACQMDEESLRQLFNQRFDQMLKYQEFTAFSQHVYVHDSGRVYPIITVDQVIDCGNYFQFNLAIVGKHYCNAIEERERLRYETNSLNPPTDPDF